MTDWIDAIDWSAGARVDAEAEKEWKAMVKSGSPSVGEANISIEEYHASERVSSSDLRYPLASHRTATQEQVRTN